MGDALFVLFLAWIAAGIGGLILPRFARPPARPDLYAALAIPLGLGVLSLSVLALGLLGCLDRRHLSLLLGFSILVAALPGTKLLVRTGKLAARCAIRTIVRGSWLDRAFLGLTAVALAGCGMVATIPVTDGDALCYHLQVPKTFLAKQTIFFEPDLHETIYPLVTELLDAIALEFRGPVACRWIELLLGLVFAGNVTLLARPVLRNQAWWAGSIALVVPAITNGMTSALNDVALAAFGTASIAASLRAIDRPSVGSAALAGCFMGMASGVKYPALVLLGILLIVMIACPGFIKSGERAADLRARLIMALAFAMASVLVGGVWYLRAYLHTGNPIFPYFRQVFGGAGLDEVMDPSRRSLAVTPWNIVTALAPMTLFPNRFESFSHQLGPVFLLFLPALLLERPPRRVLTLVAIGYAFLTLCLSQRQSMRFVLTAIGPFAVGVAYLARSWMRRQSKPASLILGILIVCLAMESAQAVGRCRGGLKVILGVESVEHYLTVREPTYQLGRWIEGHLPENACLIGQDHRGFYIPRPYSMELAHRRRTGLGRHGETPVQIIRTLRNSGFTHVLLCPPIPENSIEFDPTLGRILESWIAERTPLYRQDLADADGTVRRYSIYEIMDPAPMVATSPTNDFEVR